MYYNVATNLTVNSDVVLLVTAEVTLSHKDGLEFADRIVQRAGFVAKRPVSDSAVFVGEFVQLVAEVILVVLDATDLAAGLSDDGVVLVDEGLEVLFCVFHRKVVSGAGIEPASAGCSVLPHLPLC